MKLNYHVVDVFTKTRFGGNPLAVVLGADDLTTAQMQIIAREFNFSETSFVLTPQDQNNTAHVRIFTPNSEMDFAGHPNVGTSYILAKMAGDKPQTLVFEERVGHVEVIVKYDENNDIASTAIMSPQSLVKGVEYNPISVAKALSLQMSDVETANHNPQHVSVGANFIVVELKSRFALANMQLDESAAHELTGEAGPKAIYAYTREIGPEDKSKVGEGLDWTSRMFTFRGRVYEDPATGSAGGAMAAFAHQLGVQPINGQNFNVAQGVDIDRPSALQLTMIETANGAKAQIAGSCVDVMSGVFEV